MDFLTATVLSGITYDLLKHSAVISVEKLKMKLSDWLVDDKELAVMSTKLNELQLTDEMSETAIEKKIVSSTELMAILEKIQPSTVNYTVVQNHSGSGDNVGRDKTGK